MPKVAPNSRFITPCLSPALLLTALALAGPTSAVAAKPAFTGNVDQARSRCAQTTDAEIVQLEDLAEQIKKTKAVGMITKIKLKNQIDSFVKKVGAYHSGTGSYTIDQLREQFDLLYMKIVSLAQDKDVDLHRKLCSSWDLIWDYLQDRDRVHQISLNQ